jgi:hypothetical protein
MHPFPVSHRPLASASVDRNGHSSQRAERAYRGVTIAAMLLLLSSLWLFW